MTQPEARAGIYVYGFIRPGAGDEWEAPGIEGRVRVLELGPVAALISSIDVEEILGAAGEKCPDLEWVAPRAIRHELVVEEAMERSPILPLTFGVIFSGEEALRRSMEGRLEKVAAFLDFVADRQEWSVKVYADEVALRRHVERAPAGQSLREEIPASPGARYLQRKRLDRALDSLAAEARAGMVEEIRQTLDGQGIERRELRPTPRKLSGRREEMVLHTALLPRLEEVDAFLERVRILAEDHRARGMIVEASGPWPPYHFCPELEAAPP